MPKSLPEKYPKHVTEGSSMDYSTVPFPKPTKKKKTSRWGKK